MVFSKSNKGREVSIIIQLLTIFRTVEQVQLRRLFDYMSDADFGRVMSVLRREGLVYFTPDGRCISSSRYSMNHGNSQDSILAFWAFIHYRRRIQEFCPSDPPSIISFSSSGKDYDLIPCRPQSVPEINKQADCLASKTIRLLVVEDLTHSEGLVPRLENDYLVLVDQNDGCKMYKL